MNNIALLPNERIDLDLPLSGYSLVPGYKGKIALPVELYLQLYAIKGEEKILIREPCDLSRIVAGIENEAAAWRFLRLFTASESHYLFQKGIYTIELMLAAPGRELGDGIISAEIADAIGYEPPEMRHEHETFTASRDLVRTDPLNPAKPMQMLRRREALSERGRYCFVEDILKGKIEQRNVVVPSYE